MNEKDNLSSIFYEGEAWLRKLGIVSDVTHNSIVLNLRVRYPEIKDLEYFLDSEESRINLTLYVDLKTLLFTSNKGRKLSKYLPDVSTLFNSKYKKLARDLASVAVSSDLPIIRANRETLIDEVSGLLSEYLPSYSVTVNVEKYQEKE